MAKKIPGSNKPQAVSAPFIFTLLKKCIQYNIPTNLMERLNYTDLLYMVVDYDIQNVREHLKRKEEARNAKRGVEVVELNQEQTAAFFRGGN